MATVTISFLRINTITSPKPTLTNKEDIENLMLDEAELFRYSTALNVWLLTVKSYVIKYYPNDKFPVFENFDPVFGDENGTKETNILKIELPTTIDT